MVPDGSGAVGSSCKSRRCAIKWLKYMQNWRSTESRLMRVLGFKCAMLSFQRSAISRVSGWPGFISAKKKRSR